MSKYELEEFFLPVEPSSLDQPGMFSRLKQESLPPIVSPKWFLGLTWPGLETMKASSTPGRVTMPAPGQLDVTEEPMLSNLPDE